MKVGQKIGLILFSLVFGLIGFALFYSMTVHPFLQAHWAKQWISTPCTIVRSELKTDATTSAVSYDADLHFQYKFGGSQYISEWYGFSRGYTSDRASKESLVNQYPAGKKTNCFVNHKDPTRAVLIRERPSDIWFGLIGLPFLIVGLGVLGYTVKKIFQPFFAVAAGPKEYGNRELRLKPMSSGHGVMAAFALIWNLFIGGAIFLVAMQWKTNSNYLAAGILFLFGIVGILILLQVLPRIFVIFSPRLKMKAQGYRLGPGERIELSWTITRVHLLTAVDITLEWGLHVVPVYVSEEAPVQAHGMASVKIPQDRPTNEPVVIHFLGYVKRFPNVDRKFIITITN